MNNEERVMTGSELALILADARKRVAELRVASLRDCAMLAVAEEAEREVERWVKRWESR